MGSCLRGNITLKQSKQEFQPLLLSQTATGEVKAREVTQSASGYLEGESEIAPFMDGNYLVPIHKR